MVVIIIIIILFYFFAVIIVIILEWSYIIDQMVNCRYEAKPHEKLTETSVLDIIKYIQFVLKCHQFSM